MNYRAIESTCSQKTFYFICMEKINKKVLRLKANSLIFPAIYKNLLHLAMVDLEVRV